MARPFLICLVWLSILVVSSRGAPNDYPQTGSVSKESKSEESVSESAEYPDEYQNRKESGGARKSGESHEEPEQEGSRSTERVRRDDEAPRLGSGHNHHYHGHPGDSPKYHDQQSHGSVSSEHPPSEEDSNQEEEEEQDNSKDAN